MSFLVKNLALILFFFQYSIGTVNLYGQTLPKKYVASRTQETIIVDGKANEVSWRKARKSDLFVDIEDQKQATYNTQIQMIWDHSYLYIFAQLSEPHVWGNLKQRDTIIFYNNDFEVFIDPDGDTHDYYELEVNALNTIWDLYLSKPYRNHGKILGAWDFKGLKSAVDIQGTLNDSSDIDKGWSIEIAIPWSFNTAPGGKTKAPKNEYWRINFSRVNWDFDKVNDSYQRKKDSLTKKFLPEKNWVWSPQGVINMHEPEHWGYVYFSDAEVGSATSFEIPKDEHIKWYMYELFRKYSKLNSVEKIEWTREVFGQTIAPKLEEYSHGWTIWVESPFTKKVLSLKDDGKFETQNLD